MKTPNSIAEASRVLFLCSYGVASLLSQTDWAAPVSEQQASNAVWSAVSGRNHAIGKGRSGALIPSQPRVRRVDQVMNGRNLVGYVVALEHTGYYLVATDDELPLWKLRADDGDFSKLPPALIEILKLELAEDLVRLGELRKTGKSPDPKFHRQWQSPQGTSGSESNSGVGPTGAGAGTYLLTTTWHQDAPYNYYCPTASAGPGGRAYAGCAACAISQILRYHGKPSAIAANHTYNDTDGACQGTHSISDAGMGNYAWADMPNSISRSSTAAQQRAIAQLTYHAAAALNSDFEAIVTEALPDDVPSVLRKYFGYSCDGYQSKSDYTAPQWYNKLAADIATLRPVFYAMWQANGSTGHAVVCDGYQNGNEIHLNLGWSGSGNAWYNIESVAASGYVWTRHGAVFGITPPGTVPAIWVDFGYAGLEQGTFSAPFNTIAEGVSAASAQGRILIKVGSSGEAITITKPVMIEAHGGVVAIGQ